GIEQRIAEAKAQQISLIRDPLDIEARAVGLVQIEDAVPVEMAAPLLPLTRRTVSGTNIAVIESGDSAERAVAEPLAVFRIQQRTGRGIESRRERHVLIR